MNKYYLLAGLAFVLISCVLAAYMLFFSGRDSGIVDLRNRSEVSVVLTDSGFVPSRFEITKGTRVTFTTTREHQFWPASNPHPSHDIYPEFDPKQPIDSGSSWSFVFDKPGEWGFHDHIRSYFAGEVYVEE
jgi:plastocyanin